jgi:hypothetical protein
LLLEHLLRLDAKREERTVLGVLTRHGEERLVAAVTVEVGADAGQLQPLAVSDDGVHVRGQPAGEP